MNKITKFFIIFCFTFNSLLLFSINLCKYIKLDEVMQDESCLDTVLYIVNYKLF